MLNPSLSLPTIYSPLRSYRRKRRTGRRALVAKASARLLHPKLVSSSPLQLARASTGLGPLETLVFFRLLHPERKVRCCEGFKRIRDKSYSKPATKHPLIRDSFEITVPIFILPHPK